MFPVEVVAHVDTALNSERRFDRFFYSSGIGGGESAWVTHANRADCGVWLFTKSVIITPTEHLGFGAHLSVNL